MRGILIDPNRAPEICRLPNTEQGLADWLGGQVRMKPFGQHFAALLYTASPGQDVPNRHYLDRWYYGRLMIVGFRSGRVTSLPQQLAEQLAADWKDVEVTAR